MKVHYEKVKAAIKKSIDSDLKLLEQQEKEDIVRWKESLCQMKEDIKILESMHMSLNQAMSCELKETEYEGLLQNYRDKTSSIESYSSSLTYHSKDIK